MNRYTVFVDIEAETTTEARMQLTDKGFKVVDVELEETDIEELEVEDDGEEDDEDEDSDDDEDSDPE